jgi:hypothetical protein
MSLVQSLFSGQYHKELTADDQFTLVESVLSVTLEDSSRGGENPISRIEDNIENLWMLLF